MDSLPSPRAGMDQGTIACMDIINIENLGLKYRLYHERPMTLKERLFKIFHGMEFQKEIPTTENRSGNPPRQGIKVIAKRFSCRTASSCEDFWALNNINLVIKKGETVGLIGRNGSGKTTLLKVISKILYPTSGAVTVRGKVSPMLSIGVGFHPELTGRENIFLSGSILGMPKKEMQEKLDEIIDFSELQRFIDTPVRLYSTGMYMRLGFSIATAVDPDILLIDEVLTVGDESFKIKCYEKINQFKKQEKTIIFVSHDLNTVSRVSTRLALLTCGKIEAVGKPREIINLYHKQMEAL